MRPLEVDEPTVVGPYRLLGRLGSGGMGRVYLGRSAGGRTVAVKIVHPHFALDEEFRARFRREVDAARRVGGAWTAPVLDADPEAGVPWVATAYAAGPSLTAAVADGGPLPAHSVRVLGAGLGEALAVVHELGLVHRDVKPSNVLLTLDGPLLIDFGIARATDGTASLTSTGVSIGSPGYMSPEQILGKGVTGAADVFSLGAVLAFAATGRPPFPGDSSAALLYKVVHEEPEIGALDGEIRDLVAACLTKDPAARPAPGDVARRLAPEGAARLVTGGWLPGPLVERVSRSAVQLLNLEAAESPSGPGPGPGPGSGHGPGAGSASGPVGFSRPSVTAGAEGADADGGVTGVPGSAAVPGVFGPAPVMPAPTAPPAHVPAPPTPVPAPPTPVPAPPTPVPAPRDGDRSPGRLSVSVAATSAPAGAGRRGRRLSCTVALAVAGAMAAVTIGSVLVFDVVPGGGSKNSADDGGHTPSASAPPDAGAGGRQTAPSRYRGTWEGQAVAVEGNLPLGTFRLTVREAAVGEKLGTLRHTDLFGGTCDDVLTLKEVTQKQVVASAVGAEGNRDVCNQALHTVRLTPVGDDLQYESDSKDSGRPKARLSKVE
ncbi:serine/threonine-protein kinase [Streptomyces lancefieldiae]|uniref:Serine/threonine-protein kinase n=1 Tax=Streptomyces lancefieldiae TaxID=3075520 RepID=A0ABU3AXP5_9ACTN|nr:serine/threonine-protein kinase [Streptomyces sp. DSM 40712]MDT0613561.1 serine/threonine-protein kinase [Streptomyces sp. DSM 40712]